MTRGLIRQAVDALSAYVPGEQPDDPAVIKLNTNENPYPPAPEVMEALRAAGPDALRRYPDPVSHPLRAALAELHACAPEQVFIGNGSDEILALALRAFVRREEAVGYFDPSYSLYPVLAAIEDLAVRPVSLGPGFGWAPPDTAGLGLFFLTNPNAPTGLLFPRGEIAAFCADAPCVVLIDEAYADFARWTCLDLALSSDRVLITRSFSKSFSLAGLRLGYAVGPAPLIEALFKIKDSYNVDRLAQDAGLAAVRTVDHMRVNVRRIRDTRARVTKALRVRGFEVADSETNFLWVRTRTADAGGLFAALRARRVLVRHFPGPVTGGHLRVTVGTDAEMDAFLAALDAVGSGG
jgi:histidinol-phosphate aminotransferase